MNIHFFKITLLFVVTWMSLSLYAQEGDTLYIRRESGKIRFARFTVNENSNRKMQNDTAFLKAVLQAKKEDEFRLKSATTDELGITHNVIQHNKEKQIKQIGG